MKSRMKINNQGFYNLRKDPAVQAELVHRAEQIASDCNSDAASHGFPGAEYKVGSVQGQKKPQGRWFASVITSNGDAIRDNFKNNTLLRNAKRGE